MTFLDSLILGIVQGVTEFLPISSSGHLILVRDWLSIPERADFLMFDAVLHLATAFAIVIYFRKDLLEHAKNVLVLHKSSGESSEEKIDAREKKSASWKLFWLIVIASIPAVIAGVFFEEIIVDTFRSTETIIVTLLLGAVLLGFAEVIGKKRERKIADGQANNQTSNQRNDRTSDQTNSQTTGKVASLNITKALSIGCFQALALIPGMSRSGSTLSGGVFFGLTRLEATRFAFLMGLPVLFGAGFLKLIDAINFGTFDMMTIVTGSVSAFIVGLFSMWLLMKIVRQNSLWWFVGYRVALAIVLVVLIF